MIPQQLPRPESITGPPDPIIVLHMGGSGSRLLSDILEDAGVFMGGAALVGPWKELPLFYRDASAFVDEFRYKHPWPCDWRTTVGSHRQRIGRLLGDRLQPTLHEAGYREGPWGFKDPRSVFLAPIYADIWPRTRAIHLVRDGRDVTVSKLEKGEGEAGTEKSARAWMHVWDSHQREIRSAIDSHGFDAVTVRYEDMCQDAERVAAQLAEFLPARFESLVLAIRSRSHTRRIGAWRAALDRSTWLPYRSTLNELGYKS